MNGLALALLLGVDGAILPPAVCRATFNTTLEHLADDALWSPQPLGTLLDVRKMRTHWRERHGIHVQEVLDELVSWEHGHLLHGHLFQTNKQQMCMPACSSQFCCLWQGLLHCSRSGWPTAIQQVLHCQQHCLHQ